MHINNLPTELFVKILEYVPFKDAINIMLVDKEWHREYRGIIYRQFDAKLEELLYSHWSDWIISLKLVVYFNWHEFLLDKLNSFCDAFNILYLRCKLEDIYDSVRLEMKNIDKERKVIDDLLTHYKKSSDFEGLFPDWLWKRHKNNMYASGENFRCVNLLYTLKRKASCSYFLSH